MASQTERFIRVARFFSNQKVIYWAGLILVLLFASLRVIDFGLSGRLGGSDDVAQSQILAIRDEGYREQATTGPASFFLRFPLYILTNHLPVGASIKIFINALAVTLFATILLWTVYYWLNRLALSRVKQHRVTVIQYLSATLLAALTPMTAHMLTLSNVRNIELGLMLFVLVSLAFYKVITKRLTGFQSSILIVLSSGTGALMAASDPLFLYVFLGPLFIFYGIRFLIGARLSSIRPQLLILGVSLIGGIALKRVILAVLSLDTLHTPIQAAKFAEFQANFLYLVEYVPQLFGMSIWDGDLKQLVFALPFIVVYGILITGFLLRRKMLTDDQRELLYLVRVMAVGALTVVLGTRLLNVHDELGARYAITIFFSVLALLPLTITYVVHRAPRLYIFFTCMVVCIILGSAFMTVKSIHASLSKIQTDPIAIVTDTLKKQPSMPRKGYAAFTWANSVSFRSEQKFLILPVTCGSSGEMLYFRDLLVEQAPFKQLKATETFYLYETGTTDCTPRQLENQLGMPTEDSLVSKFDSREVRKATYSYDIGIKLPSIVTGQ